MYLDSQKNTTAQKEKRNSWTQGPNTKQNYTIKLVKFVIEKFHTHERE